MGRYRGFLLLGIAAFMAAFTSLLIYNWLEGQRITLKPAALNGEAAGMQNVVGVAGFIHPGDRVDLLVTLTQSPPVTKTVLQNVLVLATGTEIERRGKEDKANQVHVITVEVTLEEGEKLALAANEGKVQLALRNYLTAEPVLTRGATVPALLSSYRLPEAEAPKREAPAPPKREAPAPAPVREKPAKLVQVIKGSTVSTLTFN